MFTSIEYLRNGTTKQQQAYNALTSLGIMNSLDAYDPVLCGTIPLAIDIVSSDLDIVMEVNDFSLFREEVTALYHHVDGFSIQKNIIHDYPTVLVHFQYDGFLFELFGQPRAVTEQNAYRHMIVEHYYLEKEPSLRQTIIKLKESGLKTEPAFAKVLNVVGNPYDELLQIGKRLNLY
ncbi:DUF4269 domain-containing protein [Brevibacillus daliensis]|uniref:DUF4269 domain-containing protein n=1 Tax=Brevibacillus daliensis TaxID=2892995 RepID=UPI001E463B45|nr:DUF4269 domain-containing protein [Brevibacillus daliensis]